jgi:hypothetical protein
MSDGMASEKRCGIATTGEHLFHPDLILLVDDDEDMSGLSRVWWRIIDRIEYAATSVRLAILDRICCPEPRTAGHSNTPDSLANRRCDVALPAAMTAPWLIVQRGQR